MPDSPFLPTPALLAEHRDKAEAAYAAMYDAPAYDIKDLKDDSLFHFARAIEVAGALGLHDELARLEARVANIVAVYDSQFRGVR